MTPDDVVATPTPNPPVIYPEPTTDKSCTGDDVPIPIRPEFCCTTNWSVPIARPPVESDDVADADVPAKLVNPSEPAFVKLNPAASIFVVQGVCDPDPQPVQVPVTVRFTKFADCAVTFPFVTTRFPELTVNPSVTVKAESWSILCESDTM